MTIKHALSGSCGSWFLEAGGHRFLEAGGSWCPVGSVASGGCGGGNATTTVAGLTVLIFAPRGRQVSICCHHQVDFIFCFCGKGTDATAKETTIKDVSSGSCGSWLPEAGGGQCPEGGGVWMLVVAGMPPLLRLG